jgi:hypothetical protein
MALLMKLFKLYSIACRVMLGVETLGVPLGTGARLKATLIYSRQRH